MKLNKIISICNKAKYVVVHNGQYVQWIGDGNALYPVYNLPKMDKKQMLTMFDVPEDKQAEYIFKIEDDLPKTFSLVDYDRGEKMLDRLKLRLALNGRLMEPIITSTGIVFINTKYLAPFEDIKEDVQLYERTTADGYTYIAVKAGLLLVGIITPVYKMPEKTLEELEIVYQLSKIKSENEKINRQDETKEQTTFEDGEK